MVIERMREAMSEIVMDCHDSVYAGSARVVTETGSGFVLVQSPKEDGRMRSGRFQKRRLQNLSAVLPTDTRFFAKGRVAASCLMGVEIKKK